MPRHLHVSMLSLFLVAFGVLATGSALAQSTVSTWISSDGDQDWFNADNWGGGVPNSPGARAKIVATASGQPMPVLTGAATLGQLEFAVFGIASLTGTEPLIFDQPGDEPATLLLSRPSGGPHVTISTPITVAADETLRVSIEFGTALTLSGPVTSPTGIVHKTGEGELRLSAANADWQSTFSVDGGSLVVEEVNALANVEELRVSSVSTLTFVSQEDTGQRSHEYVVPKLVLDGGSLHTNRGASNRLTRLTTDIEIAQDSAIRLTTGDRLRVTGTISGPGGLRIEELHDSQASNSFGEELVFDGPASHTGPIHIRDVHVEFRHPQGMGSTDAGTFVTGGALELNGGGSGEEIRIDRGNLWLNGSVDPYGHAIELVGGSTLHANPLAGQDQPTAAVTRPLKYQDGAQLGISPYSAVRLELQGGVQGTGSLFLGEEVDIAGPSQVRGNIFSHGRGPNLLSGQLTLAGDLYVANEGYPVQLTGNLETPAGHFYVMPHAVGTTLLASHDNVLTAVTLDPRLADRVGFMDRTAVSAVDGATLTIADQLHFHGGILHGQIAGQRVLTKRSSAPGTLQNPAGSEFEQIVVDEGVLTISGDVGVAPAEVRLSGHAASAVRVIAAGDYAGDLHLNNAAGNARTIVNGNLIPVEAALTVGEETTLRGRILLGEQGSSIAGRAGGDSPATLGPEARIVGGDLVIRGSGLHIQGGQHSYGGVTTIGNRNVVLEGAGRLNSTSRIEGASRLSGSGGRATLTLDNSTLGIHDDRIPDATPVNLRGMQLTLIGGQGAPVTETLGEVRIERGLGELSVRSSETASDATTLLIENLVRTPGGAVLFDAEGPNTGVQFSIAPTLDDGLLGGWATVGGRSFSRDLDFATYGPDGVIAYPELFSYATNLQAATSDNNVFVQGQGAVALMNDKQVNALKIRHTNIDLNGHTLTLASGGLLMTEFQDVISNGQLTAGTQPGAELLISGRGQIDANLADNSQGPVGLTYSQDGGNLVLSGINTYSGPTTINSGEGSAILTLEGESALPEQSDVTINGGELRINFETATPLAIGNLVIRDSALIRSTSGAEPLVQPKSILIESGELGVPIVGDAPIVKTTLGEAAFYYSLADHSGPIDVQQGKLRIGALGEAPLDDAHAVTIHRGAQLIGDSRAVISDRKIRIDGGSIYNGNGGAISAVLDILPAGGTLSVGRSTVSVTSVVTGRGTLYVDGGYGNGRINFDADLAPFEGDLVFTGGRTAVGNSNADYAGNVTIAAAEVIVSQLEPFGGANVTVTPDGMLRVAGVVSADLDLAGGILGFDGAISELQGNLHVSTDSRIFLPPPSSSFKPKPRLNTTLELAHEANLSILGFPRTADSTAFNLPTNRREQLEIAGHLIVNGEATITSFDALVDITGSIQPGVANSTLRLEGNDTFRLMGELDVPALRSLAVEVDGDEAPIVLAGARARVTGSGVLHADVTVSAGAAISPGNSPGLLTIDGDLTLGAGSRFIAELAGTTRGIDYDALDVRGRVSLAGALLDIQLLEQFVASPDDGFVLIQAEAIEGTFSNAEETIRVGTFDLPITYLPDRVVVGIPEPSTLALAATLAIVGLTLRTGRQPRSAVASVRRRV